MNTKLSTHIFPVQLLVFGMLVALLAGLACMAPTYAYAERSDELYAQADEVLKQVDELQTSINEETARYDTAVAQRDAALAKAQTAQENIDEQQKRMDFYRQQLATLVTEMYKSGESTSFLEVVLEAASFDEFITKWDSLSSVSGKGADLVRDAKVAKASYDAAKEEYEKESKTASEKMNEADAARKEIEKKQAQLREEAEKLTQEAAEARVQEELERERARAAAAAAQAAMRAAMNRENSEDGEDGEDGEEGEALETGSLVLSGSGILNHPLPDGIPSSPFGWRELDGGSFHNGFDLAAAEGTPYYAAESGTVIYATNDGGYNGGAGNWIVISHGEGLTTIYMHSSEVFVQPGDTVKRGQKIGLVGNTGHSYGAHLHFQVEYDGVPVDPAQFI